MKKPGIFDRKTWAMLSLIIIPLAATVTAYSSPMSFKDYDSEKSAVHEDTQLIWIRERDGCEHGLHRQPNGPMAILLFCEDALGDYIGIVYYDLMGAPSPIDFARGLSEEDRVDCYKKWSLGNRMWQESLWASDVTSYAWTPDGTKLYLTTSGIYGSGAFYELDLIRKNHRQIAPSNRKATAGEPGPGYVITRIDNKEKKIFYKVVLWNSGGNVIEYFVNLN
jgi:hypothetical protein